jgi:hypothetical protein
MYNCIYLMYLKQNNWGTSFWRCIHYLAIHNKRDLLEKLPEYIPCEMCKEEFVGAKEGENLVDWSIREHNRVNGKLGKWDKWDRTDFNISQHPTCDVCDGREQVHSFPWTFMYALTETVGSEEFMKEFVAEYPCEVCRCKFIVDTPTTDEIHIEWVHRNHIRFNQDRGLPEPGPLPIKKENATGSGETTTGCDGC